MKISIDMQTTYDIQIGNNMAVRAIENYCTDTDYFVCIDANVQDKHGEELSSVLAGAVGVYRLVATEENKNNKTVEEILEALFDCGATKKTILVAIGGGITGDVVGFVASSYMRGIPFLQVPTTLLSQVDSSIGGKVAINQFGVKNLIGTFYSPSHVIIDVAFLTTLSDRLFRSGLVELLKHGFIYDKTLIDDVAPIRDIESLRHQPEVLEALIRKSLAVKKAVVEQDFLDTGLRHILNYGHTFAHALEMSEGEHLYHGECVAIGMLVMAELSNDASLQKETQELFEKFGCIKPLKEVNLEKVFYDKKRQGSVIKEVFVETLGDASVEAVETEILLEKFETAYQKLQERSIKTQAQLFTSSPVTLSGTVTIPPSKSDAHRLLLAASLADKRTRLEGVFELSDDVLVTLQVIETLGARTEWNKEKGIITVQPHALPLTPQSTVQMGESGTTLRMFLPMLVEKLGDVRIIGKNKLPFRPLQTYFECLTDVQFTQEIEGQFLPLRCVGKINAGVFEIAGDVSSQFLSGLLFVLPLLDGESTIKVTTPLESKPYVEMTLDTLKRFGVQVDVMDDFQTFTIPGDQKFRTQGTYIVEQDYSSRCFWEVAQLVGHKDIVIAQEKSATQQGDATLLDALKSGDPLDLTHIPDAAPIAAVYFAKHGGTMLHTERLQFKESDRLAAICDMMTRMGIAFDNNESEHTLTIYPGTISGGHFETYLDHRITMSLLIASTIAEEPFTMDELESHKKSYQSFRKQFEERGGKLNEQ